MDDSLIKFIPYNNIYEQQVFSDLVPQKYFNRYQNKNFYNILNKLGIYKNSLFLLVGLFPEEKVLGSIILRKKIKFCKDYHNWYIYGVAIKKEFRNKGFGCLLMKNMIEKCKELNVKKVYLSVDKNNVPAVKLYEKYGFNIEIKKSRKNVSSQQISMILSLQK